MTGVIEQLLLNAANFTKKDILIDGYQLNKIADESDIDQLGMLYEFITNPRFNQYLKSNDLQEFAIEFIPYYFLKCIKENPRSDWADSRYSATWDAVGWFKCYHSKRNTKFKKVLFKFSTDLSTLYLSGDKDIKVAIINGFFEAVLKEKKYHVYFESWKSNESLNRAIQLGMNPQNEIPENL